MIGSNSSSTLRLVPLGGLGEIGMNCLAIETEEAILIVDAGIGFPKVDLGIDVYHPDFDYLSANSDRLVGAVITHGHEDHIGAIPFLLKRFYIPVYGPCHAIGLASERLREHGFDPRQLQLFTYRSGDVIELGPFRIEPVYVTHSTADAHILSIRVNGTHIVHTGDFKFDETPTDGRKTETERLEQLGAEGVDLLLSDSTNIHNPGSSGSERLVHETLDRIVGQASQRVVIGMFSSNIQRMNTVRRIAEKHGRRICLLGRSVLTQMRVAEQCQHMRWPSDLLVPAEAVRNLDPRQVLVIATGTQAETMAALSRMSLDQHHSLKLAAGDTVILSSRIIPGNDPAVLTMIGNFLRKKVKVHTRETDPGVHVSGHGHRDEQEKMIRLLRPKAFMPVHGTLFHLTEHERFARSLGVKETIVAENGSVVAFESGKLEYAGSVKAEKIAVFGTTEISEHVLDERSMLARRGVAVVTVQVDERGRLQGRPVFSTLGFVNDKEQLPDEQLLAQDIAEALSHFVQERPSTEEIRAVVEQTLRRGLDGVTGRRPVAIAQVLRV